VGIVMKEGSDPYNVINVFTEPFLTPLLILTFCSPVSDKHSYHARENKAKQTSEFDSIACTCTKTI